MKRRLLCVPVLLVLVACGNDAQFVPEDEFITRIYEGPKYPVDFESDPAVRTVSYLGFNGDGGRTLPCVSSPVEAESLATAAGFWIEGEVREEDRYFEYDNMRPQFGRPIVRVYRSSFVRSLRFTGLFDVGWPGGGIGEVGPFEHRPIAAESVRLFFDHVWEQMHHDTRGWVLLERRTEDSGATVTHTTHQAGIVFGDFGVGDVIHQMISTFTVLKETGEVTISRTVLEELSGRSDPSS